MEKIKRIHVLNGNKNVLNGNQEKKQTSVNHYGGLSIIKYSPYILEKSVFAFYDSA